MRDGDGVERAIEKVSQVSVLKMPRQRAIKLLEYLQKLGKPKYFKGLDFFINDYGDLTVLWERRQHEIELTITGAGPLKVREEVRGNVEYCEIPTIRRGAVVIHDLWKAYTLDQKRSRLIGSS